jgi:nucleotide-binding universal stress UspA family protein
MAHGRAETSRQPVAMEAQSVPTSSRILLAIDQMGSADGAANEAIRRASESGAELLVLSVVETRNLHLPGGRIRRVDQERERLAAGAQVIVRRARDVGVRATYLIWEGDPAESILDASIAEGVNLIMLGSRPRTNLRRLILGSVSSEVTRRASCEVVVVPT